MKWEQTRNLLTTNGEPLKENWTRFENNTYKNKDIPKNWKGFLNTTEMWKITSNFFPDNPHSFKILMHNRRAKIVWLFAIRCPRSRLTYGKFSNSQLLFKMLDFIKTDYKEIMKTYWENFVRTTATNINFTPKFNQRKTHITTLQMLLEFRVEVYKFLQIVNYTSQKMFNHFFSTCCWP